MGYLISAHVFREEPNVSRLGDLPASIGYRLYRHQAANVHLLDAFRASKPARYPFQTLLPAADIPLELPSGLDALERLYAELSSQKLANAFKKSYVNAAILLNQLTQVPVFSFVSDDDLLDFTCSASDGALSRLRCRCGDRVMTWHGDAVDAAPAQSTQLHAIAIEELQAFAGINEPILGLGSFDPPEDEPDWHLVAER